MKARRLSVLLLVTCSGLLAGCSPPLITGVDADAGGVPMLRSCGTFIEGVRAVDADSGRMVWSAELDGIARRAGGHSVATLVLGDLPDASWAASTSLALDPRPVRWTFEVDYGGRTDTIALNDSDIRPGFVARTGHKPQTAEAFRDDTCGYGPGPLYITATQLRVGLLVIAMVAIIVMLVLRGRRSRHRNATAPLP